MSVILTFFLLFCQTLFSPIFYLLSFFLYFSMIYIFFPPLPLAQNMIRKKCCNIQPYNDVEILRINLKIKSYYKLLNF